MQTHFWRRHDFCMTAFTKLYNIRAREHTEIDFEFKAIDRSWLITTNKLFHVQRNQWSLVYYADASYICFQKQGQNPQLPYMTPLSSSLHPIVSAASCYMPLQGEKKQHIQWLSCSSIHVDRLALMYTTVVW